MSADAERRDSIGANSGAWLLGAILLVAFVLRWVGLDSHGLSQAESFTPGIALPDYVSAPPARMNVLDTLRTTIWTDVHPPAFYLLMLGWTKAFGTELATMRAPSVALGVLGVFALFALVRREDGRRTALLAAALVALNGLDIYFSQRARGWMLAYVLATLATALLLRIERPASRPAIRQPGALYVAVSTLGLWTSYGFWPFFVGHAAYALLGRMPLSRALEVLRLQGIALILSSSLVVVLRAQLNHSHDIAETVLVPFLRFFAFNGMVDDIELLRWQPPLGAWLFGVTGVFGAALLALGSWSRHAATAPATPQGAHRAPWRSGLISLGLALGVAALSVLGLRWLAISSLHRLVVAPAFAGGVAIAWLGLAGLWPQLAPALRNLREHPITRALFGDPPTAIVVTFAALLLTVSVTVKPMLVARNVYVVGPLCMWLVARGVLAIPEVAPRWLQAASVAALGAIAVLSVHHAHTGLYPNSTGYGPIYAQIEPQLRDGDRFAIEASWAAQPIFYYIDFEKYPSRPPEKWLAALRSPDEQLREQRIWALAMGRGQALDERIAELTHHFGEVDLQQTQRLDSDSLAVLLFERPAAAN